MELFHSVAATSIRTRQDDLAFSALPDAPVQPFEPGRARLPSRASHFRWRDHRSNGVLSALARLKSRPATVDCANVHSSA